MIEEKAIMCAIETKDDNIEIFSSISQYVKDITNSDVEKREIK